MTIVLLLLNALQVKNIAAQDQAYLRTLFKKAEQLVWYPTSPRYQELYKQLHYYPLQPYLDQQMLMHNMSLKRLSEIDKFLRTYDSTPLDYPLRKKWLKYLLKKKRKALFVNFFKHKQSPELSCKNLEFQLDLGYSATEVYPEVTKLWLVGESQPKACDRVFRRWKQAGYLSDELVWQRLALAADGGDHTLIPYLTKLLPRKDKYIARIWHKVRRNPAYALKTSRFKDKTVKETQVLTYALKRLIWKKHNSAIKLFDQVINHYPFSEQQIAQVTEKFALALASKQHNKAGKWLKKVDLENASDLVIQWRIANVLRKENWQKIKQELVSLPMSFQESHQWQYWYGRSLIENNEKANGLQVLTSLAEKRHYYGFLAASFINKPISLEDNPLATTSTEKAKLLESNAAKRAFELYKIGRHRDARREWHYWLQGLNNREKLVASKIANEQGWYDRAIFTLAEVGYLNDVDLRFPRAFEQEIAKYAQQHNINPAWALAIIRRESSFMPDANSPVGAKGLMQLMPSTAKRLAKRKVNNEYLFNANNNIKLGIKYLRILLKRNKGNQVLATASYNAGPYRVKTWLKGAETLPVDIWIETIPYKETREYVKSVMAYQQIYMQQKGDNEVLFDDLLAMQIPQK